MRSSLTGIIFFKVEIGHLAVLPCQTTTDAVGDECHASLGLGLTSMPFVHALTLLFVCIFFAPTITQLVALVSDVHVKMPFASSLHVHKNLLFYSSFINTHTTSVPKPLKARKSNCTCFQYVSIVIALLSAYLTYFQKRINCSPTHSLSHLRLVFCLTTKT